MWFFFFTNSPGLISPLCVGFEGKFNGMQFLYIQYLKRDCVSIRCEVFVIKLFVEYYFLRSFGGLQFFKHAVPLTAILDVYV